jgi:hypothetical protein
VIQKKECQNQPANGLNALEHFYRIFLIMQEVETFRQRAIEDMWWTVDNMEKVKQNKKGGKHTRI